MDGPYRRPGVLSVMKSFFPTLSNETTLPKLIDDIVKAGSRGIANGKVMMIILLRSPEYRKRKDKPQRQVF